MKYLQIRGCIRGRKNVYHVPFAESKESLRVAARDERSINPSTLPEVQKRSVEEIASDRIRRYRCYGTLSTECGPLNFLLVGWRLVQALIPFQTQQTQYVLFILMLPPVASPLDKRVGVQRAVDHVSRTLATTQG